MVTQGAYPPGQPQGAPKVLWGCPGVVLGRPVPNAYVRNSCSQKPCVTNPCVRDASVTNPCAEEAIDDWCDITELDPQKRGPALKNNLVEYASTYKPYLDRERLIDPEHGVSYFKKTLRQFFVKGASHVFLWRFMQLFKAHRGQQCCHTWLGRFGVMVTRLTNAWMDCLPEVTPGLQNRWIKIQPSCACLRRHKSM